MALQAIMDADLVREIAIKKRLKRSSIFNMCAGIVFMETAAILKIPKSNVKSMAVIISVKFQQRF